MRKALLAFVVLAAFATVTQAAVFTKGPYMILGNAETEMRMLWQADSTPTTSEIEWGTTEGYGHSSGPLKESGSGSHEHQFFHTIKDLTPGTVYYYQARIDDQKIQGSFTAGHAANADDFMFYAIGDTRTHPEDLNEVMGAILTDLSANATQRQTFLLHSGDWCHEDGETVWQAEFWNRTYQNTLDVLKLLPIMGARGNHEHAAVCFKKYLPYEPVTHNCYYSFDYGPIHFTVIDLYVPFDTGSEQHTWIMKDLAATTKPFRIALFHRSIYTADPVPYADGLKYLEPLFIKYNVRVPLSGHYHWYSRSEVDGLHHVTTGGGGAPLVQPPLDIEYLVCAKEAYHFTRFHIYKGAMTVDAIGLDGKTFDTFQVSNVAVRRNVPLGYIPQVALNLQVVVEPQATGVSYSAEDTPPAGWKVAAISHGGVWDAASGKVKWGPFADLDMRTLTYQATPPAGETGTKTFTGTAYFDGRAMPISGDLPLNPMATLCHPADEEFDGVITGGELTEYSTLWKVGGAAEAGPNPAPIGYVTRAAYLWQNGQAYHYVSTVDPTIWPSDPSVWQTGAAPAPPVSAGNSSGVRTLPGSYTPQVGVAVSIAVSPDPAMQTCAVQDAPPNNWTVGNISDNGSWDATNGMVKWGPFFGNTARTLTYMATPPAGESGIKAFSGTASFDGADVAISGAQTIVSSGTQTYTITASSGANGSLSPSGPVTVSAGSSQTFNLAPNAGYQVADVLVDGASVGSVASYTFSNVAADHSIVASFVASAGQSTCTRTLPATYQPAQGVAVSIQVTPAGSVQSYAVQDTPPASWTVSNISDGGAWDAANKQVKWGPFFDNAARTLTYTTTPPAGESGTKTFSGAADFDWLNSAIGGTQTITIAGDTTPPAVSGCLPPLSGAWNVQRDALVQLHITDRGAGVSAPTVLMEASLDQVVWETISDGSASYDATGNAVFKGTTTRGGTPADYLYVFQPAAPFDCEQTVYLRVNASDAAGNAMAPVLYNFTTETRTFGPYVRVDGGTPRCEFPAVARDANGNIWVAWDRVDATGRGHVFVARLTQNGAQFEPETEVLPDASDKRRPSIAAAPDGTIWLAYEVADLADIRVAWADMNAPTVWTAAPLVGATPGVTLRAFPAVAVDAKNTLYVAFQATHLGALTVAVAILPYGGTAWDVPKFNTEIGDQGPPAIAVGRKEAMYLVWANLTTGNLYGTLRTGDGAWNAMSTQITNSGLCSAPTASANPNSATLYLAWLQTGGTPDPDVRYAASPAGLPVNFLAGVSVTHNEPGAQLVGSPRIVVNAAGKVYLCWQDKRSAVAGDTDIMFAETRADGTIGTNIRVSKGAGNVPQSDPVPGLTANGGPCVVWTDLPVGGAGRICFAEATDMLFYDAPWAGVGGAGGSHTFTAPTNPRVPRVDVTVPPGVFSAPRDLTVSELRSPDVPCPGGFGLYLDIGGGADELLSDWITVTLHGVTGVPNPPAVYRYVPPATPLGSGSWTHDWIRNEQYDPAARTLTFQTQHLSSFGAGSGTAPSPGGNSGSDWTSSGGCAMSSGGGADWSMLLLPLAAALTALVVRSRRRGAE
jgi:hypothetical protein